MTCKCNHEETGRCWLSVDEITFQQSFKRLMIGDQLAVYTFALLEQKRLQQKGYDMVLQQITEIPPIYCCLGTRFNTESERASIVLTTITYRAEATA